VARRSDEQRRADEMFLAACMEEMDEGAEVTIVVPTKRAARQMRAALPKRDRARVVVGDVDSAPSTPSSASADAKGDGT
jgi:hypothetical protein